MTHQCKIHRHFADTDFGQLHYYAAGSAQNPILLLLHQAPSSGEMFLPVMSHLMDNYYCIAPDLPGFANSFAINSSQHTIAFYGDCIRQLVSELMTEHNMHQYYLLGHHTGAAVASYMAATDEHVKALILSGPTLLPDPIRASLADSVSRLSSGNCADDLQVLWHYIRGKDPQIDVSISQRDFCIALALGDDYPLVYQAVADFTCHDYMQKIVCATLVFAGSRDALHEYVPLTLKAISSSTYIDVGDSNTYVFETHSEKVAKIISKFLGSDDGFSA
ncbi:alpha/beta fold hydrolase [Thalassotalea maritima]|uniref:alpha/beta fold hydrolase n=1 Tax=Thalassotalea maritima TaxID=3242416 RepID=UPI003526E242